MNHANLFRSENKSGHSFCCSLAINIHTICAGKQLIITAVHVISGQLSEREYTWLF